MMPTPRFSHALINHSQMVFAIGGQDTTQSYSTCEVYHINKNYWEELEPMNKPREYAHCCMIDTKIYVLSNSYYESSDESGKVSVEYFDTKMIYCKLVIFLMFNHRGHVD